MEKKCNFCSRAIKKFKMGLFVTGYILLTSLYGTIELIRLIFFK